MSQGLEVLVFLVYLFFLVLSGGFWFSYDFSIVLPYKAPARVAGPLGLWPCSLSAELDRSGWLSGGLASKS